MQLETVFIHKADLFEPIQLRKTFVINSPKYLQQSCAGIYDISVIIKIIQGYRRPSQIIITCAHYHRKEIVEFIFYIQMLKKNRFLVDRVIYRNDGIRVKIIFLNFKIMVFLTLL
jgi:hypothetical protein